MKPEKWYIKITKENLDILQQWLLKQPNIDTDYKLIIDYYVLSSPRGDNSYQDWCPSADNAILLGCKEISFDEFKLWILKQLPKHWCIRLDSQEAVDYTNKYRERSTYRLSKFYAHFPPFDHSGPCTTSSIIESGYTELSLQEFKELVLKEFPNEENKYNIEMSDTIHIISDFKVKEISKLGITIDSFYSWEVANDNLDNDRWTLIKNKIKFNNMENKIIAYKLIKPEYEAVVVKALGLSSVYSPNIIIAGMISYYIPKIEELGIMDWFEPVYGEQFKEGDIVTDDNGKHLYEYLECRINAHYPKCYYPSKKEISCGFGHNLRLATPEEIKKSENDALLNEAKKRYPIGSRVKCLNNNKLYIVSSYECTPNSKQFEPTGTIWFNKGELNVYNNQKWAEIIPAFPEITIKNYKAEFLEEGIKFGCQKYSKEFILELYKCLETNDFEFEYRVEVEQMAQYFKNK